MTTLKLMYQKAQQYAEEVEAAILSGDFTFIEQDEHACKIIVNGVFMRIWTSNSIENTAIYEIGFDESFPRHDFKNKSAVRHTLLARGKSHIKTLNKGKA